MKFLRKKPQEKIRMLVNYPNELPSMFMGRTYIVCSSLEIGYFALSNGRIVFLPKDKEDSIYELYQETE